MPQVANSGIRICEVRIRNFRSLKSVDITLGDVTVLLGENNAGKTSFLDALNAAIGATRRTMTLEDVFVGINERHAPRDRSIMIDILIRPIDGEWTISDSFPAGSFWLEVWGNGVSQDGNDNDFVAIRTRFGWNDERKEYAVERRFLNDWVADSRQIHNARVKDRAGFVTNLHLAPISLYYMDAKRDIQDELQNRGSMWNRLIAELGLTEEQIDGFDLVLGELNNGIVENSPVLKHMQVHMNDIYGSVAGTSGGVTISPVARQVRDLGRGTDVAFTTTGAQAFSIARHGMGTRSLGAVMAFRAYTSWRQMNAKSDHTHPLLALEEPEAHLHPQAQRAVFRQIQQIPGQRIISTHSPYVASQAPISSFRHFKKHGSETIVTMPLTSGFSAEELRKIDQMVMSTRGDILYAKAVILFEGQTEEQALPVFAEHYWGRHPNDAGVEFVGVHGAGNYLPFLHVLNGLGIPWYIFSDAEEDALRSVQAALRSVGINDHSTCRNVVSLPVGTNLETYLVGEGYEDAIAAMLDEFHGVRDYLTSEFIPTLDGKPKRGGGNRDYSGAGGRRRAFVDALTQNKTQYGAALARGIVRLADVERQLPERLAHLFQVISDDRGIPRARR